MQEMVPESLGVSPSYNTSVPVTSNLRVSMLVETMQEIVPESLGSSSLTTRLLLSGLNSILAPHSSVTKQNTYFEWEIMISDKPFFTMSIQ